MRRKRTVKPQTKLRDKRYRPGIAPGTIIVDETAIPSTITCTRFDSTEIEYFRDISVDQIPPITPDQTLWVDVTGLGDKDVIEQVAEKFQMHSLSLEDVVNTHQRPKIDVYDDHIFIIVRMPHYNGDLNLEQVSLFIGRGYVVSWQEYAGDCFEPVRKRLKSPKRAVRQNRSDFLGYALVDAIVDSYFPILNQIGDRLEEIEDDVLESDASKEVVQEIFETRSDVRSLRRTAWSHREAVRQLISYEGDLMTPETILHLRDVSDHTIRIVELLEGCRESCADLRDLHMSATSMRMNEVMKVLTIIATIFIPLGFIAGVYGMNFSTEASPWNMPETNWYFGYPLAIALMASVSVGMLAYFFRKGWITGT